MLATAPHHVINLVAALLRVVDIGSSVPAASLGRLLPAVGHALASVACTLAAAGAALAIGPPLGTHCCIARNAEPPHTHARPPPPPPPFSRQLPRRFCWRAPRNFEQRWQVAQTVAPSPRCQVLWHSPRCCTRPLPRLQLYAMAQPRLAA